MERVKPIYLSRTYDIPLPNKDDPSQGWEPELFLDKLARRMGRLLKQGEPDMDGVAKIVLSDWVRGRIPFFVPPPERPEGLNKLEAKKLKGKEKGGDVKGKGKAVENEKPEVPGVKQNLGSIMQKNTFLPEDVRPLDVGDLEGEELDEEEGDEEEEDAEDDGEGNEDGLTWNDVFEGIKQEDTIPDNEDENDTGSEGTQLLLHHLLFAHALLAEDSEDEHPKKASRMKTNKVYFVVH
jgi:nuclear GTP-binding protein